MIFRRIGSCCQDDVGEFDLLDGVSHRTASECGGQTGHRHGVSETGAVIDMVGADPRSHELLEKVVFLIGAAGRGKTGDAVRSGHLLDFGQTAGDEIIGLLPGGRRQLTALFLPDQRGLQTLTIRSSRTLRSIWQPTPQ
jgi:hypothetical protein